LRCFILVSTVIDLTREAFLKEKAQYCLVKIRYFLLLIACYKTSYLNEEVNCPEPPPVSRLTIVSACSSSAFCHFTVN
jgi:hypothetical protein